MALTDGDSIMLSVHASMAMEKGKEKEKRRSNCETEASDNDDDGSEHIKTRGNSSWSLPPLPYRVVLLSFFIICHTGDWGTSNCERLILSLTVMFQCMLEFQKLLY